MTAKIMSNTPWDWKWVTSARNVTGGSEVNEVRLRMQAKLEVEVCVRNKTKNRFRKTPDARRVVVFCEC